MAESTYYEILGIVPTALPAEVKSAYRTLTTKVHPDQGGPAALFLQVQEAYETLSDPSRRAAYDAALIGGSTRGEADSAADADSGWVRVDDPPPSSTPRPEGSSRPDSNQPNNAPRTPPSSESSGPSEQPRTGPPPGPPPGPRAGHTSPAPPTVSSSRASFFTNHPSAVVAIGGLVVLWLGLGINSGIALLGLMGLVVGGVGLMGARKAQAADHLRRARIESVDAMTGSQFEKFLEQLFASKGYRVWHSGGRGDFGADLVVDGPTGRTIVQAKRWSAIVGHAAIQEVVAARGHYQGHHAIVATNSHFSEHAKKLARSNQVELWDRERIAYEITQIAELPLTPAPQRFGAELSAGAPLAFRSLLVILASLSGGKRSKRRRRRR